MNANSPPAPSRKPLQSSTLIHPFDRSGEHRNAQLTTPHRWTVTHQDHSQCGNSRLPQRTLHPSSPHPARPQLRPDPPHPLTHPLARLPITLHPHPTPAQPHTTLPPPPRSSHTQSRPAPLPSPALPHPRTPPHLRPTSTPGRTHPHPTTPPPTNPPHNPRVVHTPQGTPEFHTTEGVRQKCADKASCPHVDGRRAMSAAGGSLLLQRSPLGKRGVPAEIARCRITRNG